MEQQQPGPDPNKLYTGWIAAPQTAAEELKRLGISLGEYDSVQGTFENCQLNEVTMGQIDKLWGRFIWGFFPEAIPQTVNINANPS